MEKTPGVPGSPTIRVGSVVIHCRSLEPMVTFWSQALGYIPYEPGRSANWCRLNDPNGRVNLSFQEVAEPTPGRNKFHLDLYTTEAAAEVERLLALGATRYPVAAPAGADFVVLVDPEGYRFCVVEKSEPT